MIREACTLIFKLGGWKFIDNTPKDLHSYVLIAAPHTSNHDVIQGLAASYLMRKDTKFVIKQQWMKFPFSLVLKPAGGIGLNREAIAQEGHLSTTDRMAALFKDNPKLVLMIAPEGTRKPNPQWKTGFYYIAQKANVPLVLGFVDHKTKTAGLGKVIYPKNFEEDMKAIMDFYKDKVGKEPSNFKLDERYKD